MKHELTVSEDNPLLSLDWALATLSDHGDLLCLLTPDGVFVRYWDEDHHPITIKDRAEIFDVLTMCERIEEKVGLVIEPDSWTNLLESAVVHTRVDRSTLVKAINQSF